MKGKTKRCPEWYTAHELWHWLRRHNYVPEIADELSEEYAVNLQRAFNKGYELGQRESKIHKPDYYHIPAHPFMPVKINKPKSIETIEKLRVLAKSDDTEATHVEADRILCELLISLGYSDVVAEYNKIEKWYA